MPDSVGVVAAIVGVKNEASLIERCLDHLCEIGVSRVVVEDYGSTDGTLELVKRRIVDRSQDVTLVHLDESLDLDGRAWGEHEAALARSLGADWILFQDADEFWIPEGGSILDELQRARADVISVERFNVVLGPDGPVIADRLDSSAHSAVALHRRAVPSYREEVTGAGKMPWNFGVPMPKVAARPRAIGHMQLGNHGVVAPNGQPHPQVAHPGLVIAHLPFTDLERFELKVKHIEETLAVQKAYHAGEAAWHWKYWVELKRNPGGLAGEFARQALTWQEIERLMQVGDVITPAQYFAQASSIPGSGHGAGASAS